MSTLRQARAIFEAVVDLPAGELRAAVDTMCSGDNKLAALVLELLEVDGAPSGLDTVTQSGVARVLAHEIRSLSMPETLGRFRVLGEIGRGGMGVVYEAEQELPRRRVALKTLTPWQEHTAEARARFRREVDATAQVVHANIPQVFEVFDAGETPVMAMELVEGQDIVTATRQMARSRRLQLLESVARAVHAVHGAGVVHRDIKPSNVLVNQAGLAKVLDFGIASLGGETLRGSGTLAYAAPEQLRGEDSDVRGDVYGLGVLAFVVLTDQPPIDPPATTRNEVLKRRVEPVSHTSLRPSLAAVIRCATEPMADDRYASARELADEFARMRRGQPVHALRGNHAYWLATTLRGVRKPGAIALAGVLVGALCIGGGAALWWRLSHVQRTHVALERLEQLKERSVALGDVEVLSAFEAYLEDPSHVRTVAISKAWRWRAESLSGAQRRKALAAAWATAFHPQDEHWALEALADHLVLDDNWPALFEVLERLPPDRATHARGVLATVQRRPEVAKAYVADGEQSVLELLYGEPLSFADGAEDVWFQDGHTIVKRKHTIEAFLPSGERVYAWALPSDRLHTTVHLPTGTVWGSSPRGRGPAGRRELQWRVDAHGDYEELEVIDGHIRTRLIDDLDGDGVLERYTGTGPYTRTLSVAEPADGPSRQLHAGTDSLRSDVGPLMASDLDGDGDRELIVGTFGWRRYDLRVLDGVPDHAALVGRVRVGVRGLAVHEGPWGRHIAVSGPKAGQRPQSVRQAVVAGVRVGDGRLEVMHQYALSHPGPLRTADIDGDGVQDLIVGDPRGMHVGLVHPDGGVRQMVLVPGLNARDFAQLDDDPASEAILKIGDGWWVLGVGDLALPERPIAQVSAERAVPVGLQPWMALVWGRAESLAALGLTDESAGALEPLLSRTDAVGRTAAIRRIQLLMIGSPAEAAEAARDLLQRPDVQPSDRLLARRALLGVADLDALTDGALSHDVEEAVRTELVGPKTVHASMSFEHPGEVQFVPGEGLKITVTQHDEPVISVPLHALAENIEVRAVVEIEDIDWAGRLSISVVSEEEPGTRRSVSLGRGGGGLSKEHRLALRCDGLPGHVIEGGLNLPSVHRIRLTQLDNSVFCASDALVERVPNRARPTGPVRLEVRFESNNSIAAFRGTVRSLELVGASPRTTKGRHHPAVYNPLADAAQVQALPPLQQALFAVHASSEPPVLPSLTDAEAARLLRLQPHAWTGALRDERGDQALAILWGKAYQLAGRYRQESARSAALSPALDAIRPATLDLSDEDARMLAEVRADALRDAGRFGAAEPWLQALHGAGERDMVGLRRVRDALERDDREAATQQLLAWIDGSQNLESTVDFIADNPAIRELLPEGFELPERIGVRLPAPAQ